VLRMESTTAHTCAMECRLPTVSDGCKCKDMGRGRAATSPPAARPGAAPAVAGPAVGIMAALVSGDSSAAIPSVARPGETPAVAEPAVRPAAEGQAVAGPAVATRPGVAPAVRPAAERPAVAEPAVAKEGRGLEIIWLERSQMQDITCM